MLKDIKVYIDNDDFGVYKFDYQKQRYQGEIGYITLDKAIKCVNGDIDLDHIRIEVL